MEFKLLIIQLQVMDLHVMSGYDTTATHSPFDGADK